MFLLPIRPLLGVAFFFGSFRAAAFRALAAAVFPAFVYG
jgi:hypothetical protein